jgi:hypothetical protein
VATSPLELCRFALGHAESAAGFYNRNIRVPSESGPVIVQIPIHDTDSMDLRI